MRPFVLALVVNDTLFATIIGASFTACLALMAWMVRTLATLSAKVDFLDERVERLERWDGRSTARR